MNRTFLNGTSVKLTLMLAVTLAASVGCTTKNYVKQQTTPLINKTNELDDMTAKNSRDHQGRRSAGAGRIQNVQAQAAAADQKASGRGKRSGQGADGSERRDPARGQPDEHCH